MRRVMVPGAMAGPSSCCTASPRRGAAGSRSPHALAGRYRAARARPARPRRFAERAAGHVRGLRRVPARGRRRSASCSCGYSMGGRIALHVALAPATRVARLVLVGATPGIADPAERAARARRRRRARRPDRGAGDRRVRRRVGGAAAVRRRCRAGSPSRRDEDRLRNTAAGLAAALRGLGTGVMPPLWDRLASCDARDARRRRARREVPRDRRAAGGALPGRARRRSSPGAGHARARVGGAATRWSSCSRPTGVDVASRQAPWPGTADVAVAPSAATGRAGGTAIAPSRGPSASSRPSNSASVASPQGATAPAAAPPRRAAPRRSRAARRTSRRGRPSLPAARAPRASRSSPEIPPQRASFRQTASAAPDADRARLGGGLVHRDRAPATPRAPRAARRSRGPAPRRARARPGRARAGSRPPRRRRPGAVGVDADRDVAARPPRAPRRPGRRRRPSPTLTFTQPKPAAPPRRPRARRPPGPRRRSSR